MPVAYPDTRVLPVAQRLMACLVDAALANPKPPALVGFRTGTDGQPLGATAADECCEGAAFIRVVRTYPTFAVPTPTTAAVRCVQPMGAEFEITMWRCAAMGTLTQVPSQALWDELHTDLLNDRATMLDAVCCFIAVQGMGNVSYEDWRAISADGGCAGGSMVIQADLLKGL